MSIDTFHSSWYAKTAVLLVLKREMLKNAAKNKIASLIK